VRCRRPAALPPHADCAHQRTSPVIARVPSRLQSSVPCIDASAAAWLAVHGFPLPSSSRRRRGRRGHCSPVVFESLRDCVPADKKSLQSMLAVRTQQCNVLAEELNIQENVSSLSSLAL
jgi:hypothetical protein